VQKVRRAGRGDAVGRKRRSPSRGRSLAVAGVLGLCAVTSSSTPALAASTPKITPSFVAKVNAACRSFSTSFDKAGERKFPYPKFNPVKPQVDLLKKVGRYFDKGTSVWKSVPRKLRALGMPAQGAATWRKIRALADKHVAAALTQARTATAGNAKGFVAAVREETSVTDQLNSVALAAGFTAKSACATFFG
jgi:hypothetical protein